MQKTILTSLWMHTSAGRRHIAGIYRYVADKGKNWDIHNLRLWSQFTLADLEALIQRGLDGVIDVGNLPPKARELLAKANIPEVIIDQRGIGGSACVLSDDEAVGRKAAEHLLCFGNFRSFGYVPKAGGSRWSYLRMKGFALGLASKKRRAIVKGPKINLGHWLKGLERPAAVFCAADEIATEVLREAKLLKIRVPREISVLGVDDDELICDNVRPTLSSVRPGHEACGYAAAEALERLMRRKKVKIALLPPAGVTDRASIAPCVPASALVSRAIQAITEHAKDGWGVDDIAKNIGVSRRLLSLRFAELQRESVHDAIVRQRLSEAQRLLSTTKLKIKDVSIRSGFGNVNYLKRLFKARNGLTMREYRLASSPTANGQNGKGTRRS